MGGVDWTVQGSLVERVSSWIEADAKRDATVREWQRLENELMKKCRSRGLDFTYACRSGLAEARAMRVLGKQIKAADRHLEISAGQMSLVTVATPVDALAKIRLALRVQGRYDWRPHALELLEGGVATLEVVLGRDG
ncbi:MAG: hypothetical protein R3C46_11300 [Hyphomonadaceae bacterium]